VARKTKGGRTTPKGTRPSHLRLVNGGRPGEPPADALIDGGGRDLLAEDSPIAAEVWGSRLLSMFELARRDARLNGTEVPQFESALLERCRQRRDVASAVVAGALASVVPLPLGSVAHAVVSELRRSVPGVSAWVRSIGAVAATRAWVATDVFGDQDSLIIGYRVDTDHHEHALVALIDHNLSGQAKDAWLAPDLAAVLSAWQSAPDTHLQIEEIDVDVALVRLRDAMATSDLFNGDDELRTEEFAHHRALVWSRLRRAGLTEVPTTVAQIAPVDREKLVQRFMDSVAGRDTVAQLSGIDVAILAAYLVDLRSDYEGRPLRWSPIVIDVLLADLVPRKLLLTESEIAALPTVVRAWVRFSGHETGLAPEFVAETLRAVDATENVFLLRMGDPQFAGPAKALLATLQAQGVDLSDADAISAALQNIGALPLPVVVSRAPRAVESASAEVVSSAAAATVLERFAALAEFFGDGRKLTQTGRPTLADARALVALLGTADRFDVAIGDRTFRTSSAAELPELSFMIRWAVAARVRRKEHGKLKATASWSEMKKGSLAQWVRAADALTGLGPLAGFRADSRWAHHLQVVDEFLPEIFGILAGGDVEFDELLDWVCATAEAEFEWTSTFMQGAEFRRRRFSWDLDHLTDLLDWAGVAERVGATVEADAYDGEHLVGGTLQLTPVGRWYVS
jgi:hypothetical protein